MTIASHPVVLVRTPSPLLCRFVVLAALGATATAQSTHWSYRPVVRPAPPEVVDATWCRSPLDRFVLAAMEPHGLRPSPPAGLATWLRRVSLDLTGIPPTPDELAAFFADTEPGAEARVVDRLLGSPRCAERWTQWWLDLARYADSQGYEKDALRPGMWRYRDWVIDAFRRDLPFDQFTIEQIAGDLLPGATDEQRLATAFHRQTMTNDEGGTDDEEFRVAAVIDRVDTTMSVWMGSTLGCAQCHDHKYDPFSQKEFFGLFAFFDQTEDADRPDDEPKRRVPTLRQAATAKAIELELTQLRADNGAAAAIAALEADLDAQCGPEVPVLCELPPERRRTTRLHLRGSFLTPGEVVTPGTPSVWPALPAAAPRNRLGFAQWLVARDNPLTARVIGNRIWSELFGAGIVPTLEDFGARGDPPSHPELLDWLAAEFMDDGWSLRRLLRTIVLSATYAQSSVQTALHREQDPDNRWLARGPAFRLSGETLRDQALAVSGLLVEVLGGQSVMPPQPDGVWMQIYSGERWQTAEGPDRHRRSLYTFWRRTSPHPAMLVFDAQSRESCVLRRQRTNTPLQALVVWNDPQFREPALALAGDVVLGGAADDDAARVARLWRRCLLRDPTPRESARLLALLADERRHFAEDPASVRAIVSAGREGAAEELAAWSVVAGVVMALDEFLTKR